MSKLYATGWRRWTEWRAPRAPTDLADPDEILNFLHHCAGQRLGAASLDQHRSAVCSILETIFPSLSLSSDTGLRRYMAHFRQEHPVVVPDLDTGVFDVVRAHLRTADIAAVGAAALAGNADALADLRARLIFLLRASLAHRSADLVQIAFSRCRVTDDALFIVYSAPALKEWGKRQRNDPVPAFTPEFEVLAASPPALDPVAVWQLYVAATAAARISTGLDRLFLSLPRRNFPFTAVQADSIRNACKQLMLAAGCDDATASRPHRWCHVAVTALREAGSSSAEVSARSRKSRETLNRVYDRSLRRDLRSRSDPDLPPALWPARVAAFARSWL